MHLIQLCAAESGVSETQGQLTLEGKETGACGLDVLLLQTDKPESAVPQPITAESCWRLLTCQGSGRCSRVLRTVAGRPLGSEP